MSSAEEIIRKYGAQHPMQGELYDWYFLESKAFQRTTYDWGYAQLFRFHDTAQWNAWIGIYDLLSAEVQKHIPNTNLELVPFYLREQQVLIQCKPPYDGGYSMSKYHEFLNYGSCKPNVEILEDVKTLLTKVLDSDWRLDCLDDSKEEIVQNILRKSVIGPNSDMIWAGDGKWRLYRPVIDKEQIDAWNTLL